jgi:Zn-dependent oligopeptidase
VCLVFVISDDSAANGHKGKVELWDTTYWAERQKEKLYAFSEEELRPYFPLPKVIIYRSICRLCIMHTVYILSILHLGTVHL